jgi:hypothetical protein
MGKQTAKNATNFPGTNFPVTNIPEELGRIFQRRVFRGRIFLEPFGFCKPWIEMVTHHTKLFQNRYIAIYIMRVFILFQWLVETMYC